MRSILVGVAALAMILFNVSSASAQNKYVGVKMCMPCHKGEKKGSQYEIWEKSAHAGAFKTLSSAKAVELAKKKGLAKAAAESPECLQCHAITEAGGKKEDGVACEACHGAGEKFKNMAVMKDHAKAVAAGMVDFKDEATMEKACKTCHNDKSPTFKGFNFKEEYAKIKHPRPKA
jgi:hypothetical protein